MTFNFLNVQIIFGVFRVFQSCDLLLVLGMYTYTARTFYLLNCLPGGDKNFRDIRLIVRNLTNRFNFLPYQFCQSHNTIKIDPNSSSYHCASKTPSISPGPITRSSAFRRISLIKLKGECVQNHNCNRCFAS